MEIKIYRRAIKDLQRIPKSDKRKIKEAILNLEKFPQRYGDIRVIKGVREEINGKIVRVWRLRVGKYRIIFAVEGGEVWIIRILPRKKVYKRLKD